MTTRLRLALTAASLCTALAAWSACGPTTPACSPTTCQGCCDANGICSTGDTAAACGAAGVACNVCSSVQACVARVCVLGSTGDDGGTDAGTGTDGGTDAGTLACGRTLVECSDQAILQLDLKRTVNAATIVNTVQAQGWLSTVDAVAGGSPPTTSYVYARFGPGGLETVAVHDEQAMDSMDWDIAFRRFVIRLNGGNSGPACARAAALPDGTYYDQVTSLPSGLSYASDDFFGPAPTCTFQDDGSGLTTSPATALANPNASYYLYTSCVSMTNRVFVVETRTGRHVKLQVSGYYLTDQGQANCNAGTSPGVPGGTVRVRWAYLD